MPKNRDSQGFGREAGGGHPHSLGFWLGVGFFLARKYTHRWVDTLPRTVDEAGVRLVRCCRWAHPEWILLT